MDVNANSAIKYQAENRDTLSNKSQLSYKGYHSSGSRRFRFQENKAKYLALCQRVHIKWLTITFVAVKCAIIAYFVISRAFDRQDSIVTIASGILLGIALLTYALLVIGILKKTYTFVIPYFTICILVIFMVSMKFLVDLLDLLSEKKQSLRGHIFELVAEAFLITFEIYSMVVVWRVLNYIMDYQMEEDLFFSSEGADVVRRAMVIESGGDENDDAIDDPDHSLRHAYVLWQANQRTAQPKIAVTTLDEDDENDFAVL